MKSTLLSPSEVHAIAMSKETDAVMCCDRKFRPAIAQELKFYEIRHRVWTTIAWKLCKKIVPPL